ncbi:MAG: hypothetical protein M0R80_31170 [Proteobacteria bacterium]|jgi:hypothetical protein|nr:hypothetical protein [Pseudomonadota bacterium]
MKASALWRHVWPFLAGALGVTGFNAVGDVYLRGFTLDLGSLNMVTPVYMAFLGMWMLVGTFSAFFIALGFARLIANAEVADIIAARWAGPSDRAWIIVAALLAFLIPTAIRVFVLKNAPLTDDESCYRFSAQLLAGGHLTAESPPMKLFFDREFVINDGRIYTQYFLGWPALLVPGIFLSVPETMNAFYCALTVPALFWILRRLVGSGFAKLGTALYLLSPFIMTAAATMMAHTTSAMAITWLCWFALRSRDDDAPLRIHAAVAFFFSLAFFIRPTSGLGAGLPFVAYWLWGLRGLDPTRRLRALIAFAVPAACFAALFLTVNKIQNGSFTTVAYQRLLSYSRENGYRFSGFAGISDNAISNINYSSPYHSLARMVIALFRLNADVFGWPFSLFFILAAGRRRETLFFWASLFFFFLVHFFISDSGVDTFGPVHFFEATPAIIVLTVVGLRNLTDWLGERAVEGSAPLFAGIRPTALPVALALAFALCSFCAYVPIRLGNLARLAADINAPLDAPRRLNLSNAVIFSPRPFSRRCLCFPTRHFVFWRPNNDPDLKNDVLWVNHVSVAEDRKLMQHFPGRAGYVLLWMPDCSLSAVPLDSVEAEKIPDGRVTLYDSAPK